MDLLEIGVRGLARDGLEDLKRLGEEGMNFLGRRDPGGYATDVESGGGSSDGARAAALTWPVKRGRPRRRCGRGERRQQGRWGGDGNGNGIRAERYDTARESGSGGRDGV